MCDFRLWPPTLRVNCAEITRVKPEQFVYRIFGIKRRFQQSESRTPLQGNPRTQASKTGTLLIVVILPLLSRLASQSEEFCWLCNGKVWIFKLWFVLFYIYNHDHPYTVYKLNSFFYINLVYERTLSINSSLSAVTWHCLFSLSALICCIVDNKVFYYCEVSSWHRFITWLNAIVYCKFNCIAFVHLRVGAVNVIFRSYGRKIAV